MDCSPPDSSVHRISQARILEWVAISFSRGSFWPRDWPPSLLYWQVDSLPLSYLGSPSTCYSWINEWLSESSIISGDKLSGLCHLLPVWHWTSYLSSVSSSEKQRWWWWPRQYLLYRAALRTEGIVVAAQLLSRVTLKLVSIDSVMSHNHLILSLPSSPAFNLSQHQGIHTCKAVRLATVIEYMLYKHELHYYYSLLSAKKF